MAAESQPDLPLCRFRSFEAITGIAHGVTTRHGGVSTGPYSSLNLSLSVNDDPLAVFENRRRVSAAFGASPGMLHTTRQVHRTDVLVVGSEGWSPDDPPRADSLITGEPGALLMQRFADCVPVFFASTMKPAVGLAHAGWRGTVLDVVGATVKALRAELDANPGDLIAAIGPSIGPCCFEVGPEVAAEFGEFPGVVFSRSPRPHIDLWEANKQCLIRAGLPAESIEVAGLCTRCNASDFFSHRALGYPAGRFGGVIGLAA